MQTPFEKMEAPSNALPLAPTAPISSQRQGLFAEVKWATSRLLVKTDSEGVVISKTSASGAPLSAPSGMDDLFATCRKTPGNGVPFKVTESCARSVGQLGGR